jgi:hypothetical protein
MNPDYEKRLEEAVGRELKSLPELPAPLTLISRVMNSLESKAPLRWYRRSWLMWPIALRVVSMAALLAMFGGICFASWKLTQAESFLSYVHEVNAWFTSANTLWSTLNSVLGVGVLLLKKLGTGFIVAGLLAVGMGYAMCIGLGTVYVRLALGRR